MLTARCAARSATAPLLLALGRSRRRSSFADHGHCGIRSLLGTESDLIEASLGFVVDAGRALGVAIECDVAQRLGLGVAGGGGASMVDRRGARCRLALSSETFPVTVIVPAGAPVVVRVAVLPVPLICPAEAESYRSEDGFAG